LVQWLDKDLKDNAKDLENKEDYKNKTNGLQVWEEIVERWKQVIKIKESS
jgi:hypothetical protein